MPKNSFFIEALLEKPNSKNGQDNDNDQNEASTNYADFGGFKKRHAVIAAAAVPKHQGAFNESFTSMLNQQTLSRQSLSPSSSSSLSTASSTSSNVTPDDNSPLFTLANSFFLQQQQQQHQQSELNEMLLKQSYMKSAYLGMQQTLSPNGQDIGTSSFLLNQLIQNLSNEQQQQQQQLLNQYYAKLIYSQMQGHTEARLGYLLTKNILLYTNF